MLRPGAAIPLLLLAACGRESAAPLPGAASAAPGAGRDRPHWAFVPPEVAPRPPLRRADWCRDELDRYVLARIEAAGLAPSPEADRATLLRRVSLALTGLPPAPEEVDAFAADPAADAYERRVDALLASPRYGERMAVDWLDAARFADTYGYQADWECRVWPWRDWVIAAFNRNQPYDQFVRQQLAGDLLPDADAGTRLATAFNRLHRQTNEGGSIDAEFRQEYVSDRVHTFGTTFLGLTVECARCHDHKFDPVSQEEYYSLCAFFSSIDEAGTYPYSTGATPRPAMRLPSPAQATDLALAEARLHTAERDCEAQRAARLPAFRAWLDAPPALAVASARARFALDGGVEGPTGDATRLDGDSGPSFPDLPAFRRCDPYSLVFWMLCPDRKARATVVHTSTFTIESDQQGYQVLLKDGRLCWEVIHLWPGSAAAVATVDEFPLGRWVQVAVTYDGSSRAAGLRVFLDGAPAPVETVRDQLDGPATVRSFQVGFRDRDVGFQDGRVDDLQLFDRCLSAVEVAELQRSGALAEAVARAARGEEVPGLLDFFLASDAPACAAAAALRQARAAHQDLLEAVPEIMVMEESRYPRAASVLTRGRYDQPDHARPVRADRAIDALLPFDAAWPRDRRGLAEWLTSPRNPLTARVEVNRLWSLCFGRGLVPTQENFGRRGEPPAQPEVLDLLAHDFVAGGWDIKAMLRRIVLSATFRQASAASPALLERDPANQLLARGPSYRLSGEALRDQALAASGLLVERLGGPSVRPWQPAGLWEDAGATGAYQPDTGDGAHRRSLYTYRKRTAPPPALLVFDAGSREQCLARRAPTNTPLQALVCLNDPVFFECAQALARRAAREAGPQPRSRVERAFRLLASRPPRAAEMAALLELYQAQEVELAADPAAARAILGADPPDPALAALALVCSTLLASDAVVTSR